MDFLAAAIARNKGGKISTPAQSQRRVAGLETDAVICNCEQPAFQLPAWPAGAGPASFGRGLNPFAYLRAVLTMTFSLTLSQKKSCQANEPNYGPFP
jgi:hypothetical protein